MPRAILIDPEKSTLTSIDLGDDEMQIAEKIQAVLQTRVLSRHLTSFQINRHGLVFCRDPSASWARLLNRAAFRLNGVEIAGKTIIAGCDPSGRRVTDSPSIEQMRPFVKRCQ